MRRLLLLIVLAMAALATPATATPATPARTLSVLSFNIHHGAGEDGVFDLDRVADEIRRTHADVIGMQEVDRHYGERSDWADQPAELAQRLGMHVVFGANLDLEPPSAGQPRRQYGTAILSRHPILEWHNTLLPKGKPAEERRGLLTAVVNVRGVQVRVMNTHLQHDSAASRLLQSAVVADAVVASKEPVVLTGDLNAVPAAPEITTLTAHLRDGGNAYTYPADVPTARIDYVLTNGLPLFSKVLPTAASDHRPVLTALMVRRAR
ncbi:endonuclease/exonuclease/phosphatase family protein [Actinophytocola glycyrrhizae]|uniref:Endonuclease/exonuclease/phosphatase family protein n=1 Tax=Actinophytocola glycyrrhizae TaxID=2044873 RepID=A0ABV9RYR0_9PSEU